MKQFTFKFTVPAYTLIEVQAEDEQAASDLLTEQLKSMDALQLDWSVDKESKDKAFSCVKVASVDIPDEPGIIDIPDEEWEAILEEDKEEHKSNDAIEYPLEFLVGILPAEIPDVLLPDVACVTLATPEATLALLNAWSSDDSVIALDSLPEVSVEFLSYRNDSTPQSFETLWTLDEQELVLYNPSDFAGSVDPDYIEFVIPTGGLPGELSLRAYDNNMGASAPVLETETFDLNVRVGA